MLRMFGIVPDTKKFLIPLNPTNILWRTSPLALNHCRIPKFIIINGFLKLYFVLPIIAEIINVSINSRARPLKSLQSLAKVMLLQMLMDKPLLQSVKVG